MCGKPLYKTTAKVCSVNCSLEYNLKYPEKVKNYLQELEEREWKAKKKEIKEKLKTLSELEAEAKKEFQKYIRKRDEGLKCISCDAFLTKYNTHASHYYAAGTYSGLIFEETNCHSSCVQCNTHLHGNLINYRLGLIKRYGHCYLDKLEAESVARRNYKYTKEELIAIKLKYKEKAFSLPS